MGKRAKKKVQTTPGKLVAGSRIASSSPSSVTSMPLESGKFGEKCSSLVETGCPHGANIDKLRTQLAKSSAIHCQECAKLRSGPAGGKDRRVKGKPLKKKVHNSSAVSPFLEEKNSTHKLWICLSCGHTGCGAGHSSSLGTNGSEKLVAKQGVVGRGHAWQHWLQLKHPMVMQCGDEFACWCFQCEAAHEHKPTKLDVEKPFQNGEVDASVPPSRVELMQQSAKLVQKKLMEQVVEVKEVSADGAEQEDGKLQTLAGSETGAAEDGEAGKPKRIFKGLVNLGNTCFFNSVMQNLLGVEILRDHFLVESAKFEGPLTTSLRKFFQEISVHPAGEILGVNGLEGGLKRGAKARGGWSGIDGVHNPKGLFGAICSKVPRFKGYQQQDSHELLKCLLDGLHTEEETALKLFNGKADTRDNGVVANGNDREHSGDISAQENGSDGLEKKKQIKAETFVERVFGGQLSSTVSCCECGHSSVVYEPFLDLSLSIPVTKSPKRLTPLQSATEQGTNRVLSKSQRAQSFKSKGSQLTLKTSGRSDLDDDVLNCSSSQIAGLGTPLLLLPPPPPKESNVDNLTLGTVSDDASWLDFLNGAEGLESQVTYGCAPNPDLYESIGCAPNPDSQMVLGCLEDGAFINQAGYADGDASLHALDAHRFTEVGDESGVDGSLTTTTTTTTTSTDHSLDVRPCVKLLLLEAPRQSWSETHIHSNWFESERSNYESSDGPPEEDGYIQIRGGSDSQVLLLTQGNETDYFSSELIAENSSNQGTSAEQSGNCGDDSKLHSEDVICPSDTGLTLDSATGDGEACTNLEVQGDYDGVASLFEEEDNTEYAMHGPFPLNHDASGYEGSSVFEEVGLDDVLDLGKVNCEGREDWLVCTNDRQDDDSEEVTMSLEGCLQIFTRPEILSGENAWGCEECTSKYHEKLAAVLVRNSVTLPQKDPVKRITKKGRFGNGSMPCEVSDLDSPAGEKPLNSSRSEEDLGSGHEANCVSKDAASDLSYTSDVLMDKGAKCNGIGTGVVTVKMYPTEEFQSNGPTTSISTTGSPPISCGNGNSLLPSGVSEQRVDTLQDAGLEMTGQVDTKVGNTDSLQENGDSLSVCSTSEPVDLRDAANDRLSNGSVNTIDEGKDVSGSQSSNPGDNVEGDECDMERSEAEVGRGELEKVVGPSSSGRTLKLTKSRSKKVVAEPRKIIKQEATKRYLISKAPPVLVVQLKRFARDMRGRLSKLYGPVAFQECLDLHPYVDHRHVTSQNCRYRLTGTVEHTGTLKGGHYVAYVRGPPAPTTAGLKQDATGNLSGESSWYHISDSYVRQTSLDTVLKSEAYLLFYERC